MNQPDFEAIKQANSHGGEYWSARDLMPLLGYTKWQRFNDAIKRAMISCEKSRNDSNDHFSATTKPLPRGNGAFLNVQDYNLSRLACYLIAMNGEPSKPEISAAQQYFAVQTRKQEMHELRQHEESRLILREKIEQGNIELRELAAAAGVESPNWGRFFDEGWVGLYGMTKKVVTRYKGLDEKEDITNYQGLKEAGANALRIGFTNDELRAGRAHSGEEATRIHREVGEDIRELFKKRGALLPEDLPLEGSIKPLLDEKKRQAKKAKAPKEQAGLFGGEGETGGKESKPAPDKPKGKGKKKEKEGE